MFLDIGKTIIWTSVKEWVWLRPSLFAILVIIFNVILKIFGIFVHFHHMTRSDHVTPSTLSQCHKQRCRDAVENYGCNFQQIS